MRLTVGVVTLMTTLVLGGCGTGGNQAGKPDDPDDPDISEPGRTVASLSGIELCAMVDHATIEQQFGESIRNALGGREPEERTSVTCTYVTDSVLESDMENIADALSISTNVRTATEGASTAREALDAYFVDQDAQTVAYTPVDGLGAVAGYAGSDLRVRLGGNHLVAILEVGGTFIEVITKSDPEGTMRQLRPIAHELVAGVESALG
jgi:hypothetical protein